MLPENASLPTDSDREAFALARTAIDRTALNRYLRSLVPAPKDKESHRIAKAQFAQERRLDAPGALAVALHALCASIGDAVASFVWTVWPSLYDTKTGTPMHGSWADFGDWHRAEALLVAKKGEGTAYNPTTNASGHRTNVSTRALHALILDCDGTGDWDVLLTQLDTLGLSYVAHRSGGHRPPIAKWRVAVPLSQPFDTTGKERIEAWRDAYAAARTVFGAVARLTGHGFDPATDGPFHPWLPGTRRQRDDPPRDVIVREGGSLDLEKLVAQLPRPLDPGRAPHNQKRRAPSRVLRYRPTPDVKDGASLLVRAFAEAGMLGQDLGDKHAVRCPWNHLHSDPLAPTETPSSATVVFAASDDRNIGGFYCAHASCGAKSPREVLEALPSQAVEAGRREHEGGRERALTRLPAPVVPPPPRSPAPPTRPSRCAPHGLPRVRSAVPSTIRRRW